MTCTRLISSSRGITLELATGFVKILREDGTVRVSRIGRKENALLKFLLANTDRIVTKDEILQHVWAESIVCENVVAVALSNIRKILKKADEDCQCLKNVSGCGYIFNPAASGFSTEL